MLNLFSGAFHPDLETLFIERLKKVKKDPLSPVAVVTASSRLSDRLQLLLTQHGLTMLQLSFHTFSSLAEAVVQKGGGLDKPILSDPLFYDTLVQVLLDEKRPFRIYNDMAVPQGFPAAVRSTLRDLLDAGVDGDLIQSAMEEQFVGREVDVGSLRELLTLYRLYLERLSNLPVSPTVHLIRRATEMAPQSAVLKQFKELMFYGFYDLTGVQTEFFESVVRHHPASFFFPYEDGHPDAAFAKRFRDNTLQRMEFKEVSKKGRKNRPKLKLFNVSGQFDEAWIVAREIRRLNEESGVAFSEIAVVARSRERLKGALPSAFNEQNIPFHTTARPTLAEWPLAPLALELLSFVERDEIPVRPSDFSNHPDFFGRTEDVFSATRGWPSRTRWSDYAERSRTLVSRFFKPGAYTQELWGQINEALSSLATFDQLGTETTFRNFLSAFQRRLTDYSPEDHAQAPRGVSLLHAEAARGLSFQAIFLIGLEEKVFPRLIREDPFLRDDARQALRDTVGYKIGQKLTALEEERLLFHLLRSAAEKELVIVYQRSDAEGKVVGASPFLRALAKEEGLDMETDVESVPRSAFQKIARENPRYLSATDLFTRLIGEGRTEQALSLARTLNRDESSLSTGLRRQAELHQFGDPGAWDGLIGPVTPEECLPKGAYTPTSLETFGRCPYQFHAYKMLELEKIVEPETRTDLPADKKGKMIHAFLEEFFKAVTSGGRTPPPADISPDVFESCFNSAFPDSAGAAFHLPPLLWRVLRSALRQELEIYLSTELPRLASEGLAPTYFELTWKGILGEPLDGYPWTGQMDRVDMGRDRACVVDYKSGTVPDGKVATEAIRGRRFQPPLYILMARDFFSKHAPPIKSVEFAYHQIGRDRRRARFSSEEWDLVRPNVLDSLGTLLGEIKRGAFLIYPDSGRGVASEPYCDFCKVEPICRKHHSPSAYRATRGPGELISSVRNKSIKVTPDEE